MVVPVEREMPVGLYEPLRELLVTTVNDNRKSHRRRLLVPGLVGVATLVAGGVAAASQLTGDAAPRTTPSCVSQDWQCIQPLATQAGVPIYGPSRDSNDTVTDALSYAATPQQIDTVFHFADPSTGLKGEVWNNTVKPGLPSYNPPRSTTTKTTIHGLPANVYIYPEGAMAEWQEKGRDIAVSVTNPGATVDQAVSVAQSFVFYTP